MNGRIEGREKLKSRRLDESEILNWRLKRILESPLGGERLPKGLSLGAKQSLDHSLLFESDSM